jgi:N-dimethylarginine dimethylaminohydrolase
MAMDHIYSMTVKMFGSQPEPAFESQSELEANWGQTWGCDNDVGQLRKVLMHRPGDEFNVIDPSKRIEEIGSFGDLEKGWYFQSDTIPDLSEMQAQHDNLAQTLRDEGAEVIMLDGVSDGRFKSIYTRDSSFAIKGGSIVTRLAPRMRRGEELPVTRKLAEIGMPILRTVNGTGILEGGSFAWLNSKTAVLGRSIRINDAAISQVSEVLSHQGVELIVVDMCGYSIHIDGSFLMIDKDLALLDASKLPYQFLMKLEELNIRRIEITPEDNPWIINSLAVAPGRVVMPYGISDHTRDALERNQVRIVELEYSAVQHNGGGIHCSTCPLVRDPIH